MHRRDQRLSEQPLTDRLTRALEALTSVYGPRPHPRRGMEEVGALVATILSQSTTDANANRGYRSLRRVLPTWDAVADAPVQTIERAIRCSGLSRQKAPRIRAILRQIRDERGRVSLRFLRRMPPAEAMAYLCRFPGVGPKTAACVLLFACRMPLFPVDTHVHRIALRTGWLPPRTPATAAQEQLEATLRPEQRYPMHVLLLEHGKRVCRPQQPRCASCCLRDDCRFGQLSRPAPRTA
ncbi:MAG: endonuclease III domain-containing protein [Tepidisphaerales bacterium]